MTILWALLSHCQFVIAEGPSLQSPSKSAGAVKKGSLDERRESWWIKASYIWYHPVTSLFLQYLVLSTVGPRSLKSFFSLISWDRTTGTVHLVCYWEHTQSNPPMHTLIFKVCVWLQGWLWPAETCSSLLWENFHPLPPLKQRDRGWN